MAECMDPEDQSSLLLAQPDQSRNPFLVPYNINTHAYSPISPQHPISKLSSQYSHLHNSHPQHIQIPMFIPLLSIRREADSPSTKKRHEKRKGGGGGGGRGGGGGGGRGGGVRGGSGGVRGGSGTSISVAGAGSSHVSRPYSFGGGRPITIPSGPYAGRAAGGGDRNGVVGTKYVARSRVASVSEILTIFHPVLGNMVVAILDLQVEVLREGHSHTCSGQLHTVALGVSERTPT